MIARLARVIRALTLSAAVALCAAHVRHVRAADAAPDAGFEAIERDFRRETPTADLVEKLYDFMHKYPKDPRSDRVQLWAGITQQRRNYHNEAIKELGFVASEFSKSAWAVVALRRQADSYQVIAKPESMKSCYEEIAKRRLSDIEHNREAVSAFRDAMIFLAQGAMDRREPDVDAAVGYLLQLPDRNEAITRVVEAYVRAGKFEEAFTAIKRLPASDRHLGYRLLAQAYAARPGVEKLVTLLNSVIDQEKPSRDTDDTLQAVLKSLKSKGVSEHDRGLCLVAERYERLRRWAHHQLCELHKSSDLERLVRFIGDYHTGGDVEQVKRWVGELHESRGEPAKAREAYGRLDNTVEGHFLTAETYYGPRAKNKDLAGGQNELTAIVKRFYSPSVCCEALLRRADLEAGAMGKREAAIASLRELVDRFPTEGDFPVRALMRMGELFRSIKKHDEAIACYERVIKGYAESRGVPSAWYEMGVAYEEKGDKATARKTLQTVLRKFQHSSSASAAHSRLESKYGVADVDVADR